MVRNTKKTVYINIHYYKWMTKIVFKKLSNGGQISILKATINSFLVQMDKY